MLGEWKAIIYKPSLILFPAMCSEIISQILFESSAIILEENFLLTFLYFQCGECKLKVGNSMHVSNSRVEVALQNVYSFAWIKDTAELVIPFYKDMFALQKYWARKFLAFLQRVLLGVIKNLLCIVQTSIVVLTNIERLISNKNTKFLRTFRKRSKLELWTIVYNSYEIVSNEPK
jgi:hypothetical protein